MTRRYRTTPYSEAAARVHLGARQCPAFRSTGLGLKRVPVGPGRVRLFVSRGVLFTGEGACDSLGRPPGQHAWCPQAPARASSEAPRRAGRIETPVPHSSWSTHFAASFKDLKSACGCAAHPPCSARSVAVLPLALRGLAPPPLDLLAQCEGRGDPSGGWREHGEGGGRGRAPSGVLSRPIHDNSIAPGGSKVGPSTFTGGPGHPTSFL